MEVKQPFWRLQPSLVDFVATYDAQLVCDFVGAARKSVRRWVAGSHTAKGVYELRLWYFLEAAGYDVPLVDEFNRYVAQLLAHSIITMDEARQYCGVLSDQTAFHILRGQTPMHPAVTLSELQELHDDELQASVASLAGKLQSAIVAEADESVEQLTDTPPADAISRVARTSVLVTVLADQLKAVLPLTEIAIKDWSAEERSTLRELVGDESMFVLSNNLNALCSERARNQQRR